MNNLGTLYFLSGKMGAGKTTKSRELKKDKNAVLLSEDEWLESLYPKKIKTFEDYQFFSKQIQPLIKKHIQNILNVGSNVVMDFPGNTKNQRQWLLNIANEINAKHELIYLNVNNQKCLEQIKQRQKEEPERKDFDTEDTFNYVTSFFEEPKESEGIKILEIKK
ncbi:AAA family ATPase [Staphylococcus equorum]|uniref:AAA family ATPase n=1 Tax=Staphylococcus equorum TaxID=246432 RepID=UPI000E0344CF|nr:ATP-binding protein [Staphylococcus equorum]QQT22734.1 ATP-binding protein [Staphylococcus equorum]RTX75973.1 ATP-binding protein [Staphylococcus equorum subsp. equorum]SUM23528.1 UMP-CMP kinase family [Staphylococcus equorum]